VCGASVTLVPLKACLESGLKIYSCHQIFHVSFIPVGFDILSRKSLRGVLNNCIIFVCTSQDTIADNGDFPPFR
jgi:hypothetical protein